MLAVRAATEADLETIYDVWVDADGIDGRGVAPRVLPLHAHELRTGTLLVCEQVGDVVGFGAVVERDGVAFLADLFVRRRAQSQGVGRALMQALFEVHGRAARATMASSDARAGRLYRAFGMHDRFANHYLASIAPWPGPTPLRATEHPIDDELAALDEKLYGRCRRVDLDYWAGLGARAAVFASGGATVGYALVCPHTPWHPDGDAVRIGPIVARDEEHALAATLSAVGFAAAMPDRAPTTTMTLPAGHPASAALLSTGFVVTDHDVFMSTTEGLVDPSRMTFTPDLL